MSNPYTRIVVTDSGLGGFNICAEIAARYANYPLQLIYFNAQPEYDGGYNTLPEIGQKQRIFDRALQTMQQRYTADRIIIACNTLSVLYTQTQFYKQPPLPVFDIINCGVEKILGAFEQNSGCNTLILGTNMTIQSHIHRDLLVAAGMPAERIFEQACPRVAILLEHDLQSREMEALLESFLAEACGRILNHKRPLLVALCCTHYHYIQNTVQRILQKYYSGPIILVNPNQALIAMPGIIPATCQTNGSRVKIEVVSLVPFPADTKQNISAAVEQTSFDCAEALRNYQ